MYTNTCIYLAPCTPPAALPSPPPPALSTALPSPERAQRARSARGEEGGGSCAVARDVCTKEGPVVVPLSPMDGTNDTDWGARAVLRAVHARLAEYGVVGVRCVCVRLVLRLVLGGRNVCIVLDWPTCMLMVLARSRACTSLHPPSATPPAVTVLGALSST